MHHAAVTQVAVSEGFQGTLSGPNGEETNPSFALAWFSGATQ